MFSLIRKALRVAQSFDAVSRRVAKVEARVARIYNQLERYERLADENAALWDFLDQQKEAEGVYVGSAEDFEYEISDAMLRAMKTQGDA
jgi:3-methyladenine DNA glycosylase Tag